MKFVIAMLGAAVLTGSATADDVNWLPAKPIQTTRTIEGVVVVPVESPTWQGPKLEPAAKLGLLSQSPTRPPESLPPPRELPALVNVVGPTLLPSMPIEPINSTVKPAPPIAPTIAKTSPNPVAVSAQPIRTFHPQPWGPPTGPRPAGFERNPLARLVFPKS